MSTISRVCLVPGHGPDIDRGAANHDGTTELDWNRDLVNKIAALLPDRSVVVHRTTERLSPVTAINATKATFALEFHLNASNRTASGTEMIYWPGSSRGLVIAQKLLDAAVNTLNLPNRGVKQPWNGRGALFLKGTSMPAVIVESFFIDNDRDLHRGNTCKAELAAAYAAVISNLL